MGWNESQVGSGTRFSTSRGGSAAIYQCEGDQVVREGCSAFGDRFIRPPRAEARPRSISLTLNRAACGVSSA